MNIWLDRCLHFTLARAHIMFAAWENVLMAAQHCVRACLTVKRNTVTDSIKKESMKENKELDTKQIRFDRWSLVITSFMRRKRWNAPLAQSCGYFFFHSVRWVRLLLLAILLRIIGPNYGILKDIASKSKTIANSRFSNKKIQIKSPETDLMPLRPLNTTKTKLVLIFHYHHMINLINNLHS